MIIVVTNVLEEEDPLDVIKYQCVTCAEKFSHYKDLNTHIEIHNRSKCKN